MENNVNKVIYDNLKKNSIGKEKKAKANFIKQKVVLTISMISIVTTLLTACAPTATIERTKDPSTVEAYQISEMLEENNISSMQVTTFQKGRVVELLTQHGFTDFTDTGNKRHYNYTYSDYEQIKELDESYLYGFYILADLESFNEMVKSMGYKDLEDFLIQHNYVDELGNPDTYEWNIQNMQEIIPIMVQRRSK